ncbi:J domain-containing protein [Desulfonauticus submarinus]
MKDIAHYFTILQLKPGASLQEVKAAYRRLAFKYHPDLNPSNPNATLKFQEINQAYVYLKNYLKHKPSSPHKQKKSTSPKKSPKQTANKTEFKNGSSARQTFNKSQEEILKEILEDPFARKVFEDIFAQAQTQKTSSTRSLAYFKEIIKSWWINQLNHEQIIYLAPSQIKAGTKIKITVNQKFSSKTQVEITIPLNYKIGQPIRLKKLGRKFGPWQGDLYLKIYPKNSN